MWFIPGHSAQGTLEISFTKFHPLNPHQELVRMRTVESLLQSWVFLRKSDPATTDNIPRSKHKTKALRPEKAREQGLVLLQEVKGKFCFILFFCLYDLVQYGSGKYGRAVQLWGKWPALITAIPQFTSFRTKATGFLLICCETEPLSGHCTAFSCSLLIYKIHHSLQGSYCWHPISCHTVNNLISEMPQDPRPLVPAGIPEAGNPSIEASFKDGK